MPTDASAVPNKMTHPELARATKHSRYASEKLMRHTAKLNWLAH
jgi:hypothetical protein